MTSGGGLTGSMPSPGSSVYRKSADAVSDRFPAGLRVLVVDDDPTCLTILEKMLKKCLYAVTKCSIAETALSILRKNKNGFDIVISDVHMPDMDGFKLLELIGLEMDLPVIMMSADDSKSVVMKGVTHGACDYLIKPVRKEELKNIWQHVVRRKKIDFKDIDQSGSLDDGDRQHRQDENEYSSPSNEGDWQSGKRKAEDEDSEDNNDAATLKKPRVVWSVELHQKFVAAVNQLGIDKAVPKKILELMSVPGLTRENVASHLQKYRLYLRRLSGVSQHQSGLNSFMGPQDPGFGTMSSLGGIDYQTLAVTGRLPAQTLAAYQAGIGRSTVKSGISMPFVEQRNLFSFETPKIRYREGQQQQLSNTDKEMNMLHGIPTTMEPKQLANLHQPAQPLGGLNMQTSGHGGQGGSFFMQMAQSQSKGHLLNESMGIQASGIHPSIGQTLPSCGAAVGILPRNGMVDSARGLAYNAVTQSSSMVDFSVIDIPDLPGNSFPVVSTAEMTPLTSAGGLVQTEIKSDMKASRGFAPSYDIFNELQQHRAQDYQLQNSALTYGASQPTTTVQNNVDISPSVLMLHGFSSGPKSEQNGNTLIGKTMYSAGLEHQQGISPSVDQNLNGLIVDNSSRIKTEEEVQDIISSRSNLFQEPYVEDDLMSAILKQQEGLGSVGVEFDLDGYTLGNFPANGVFTSQ